MDERPRVTFETTLRRRRLAVLLRAPLAFPSIVVLAVLSVPVAACVVLTWLCAVGTRRVPSALHRGLRVYVRYALRVVAWATLASARYPRLRGVVPPLVEADRRTQPRTSALFRLVLALPSLVLASVLGSVLLAATIAAWFVALVRGRTTPGLLELSHFCIRYQAETLAFVLLLTASRPRLEPVTAASR